MHPSENPENWLFRDHKYPQATGGFRRKRHNRSETENFWTGDIGFMDHDGWFFLVDRKKDVIIASGYKVWPREVEDVLYEHPSVREAAVVGVEDSYRGETVRAFVSLKRGEILNPLELVEICRTRLAAYKYPRSVSILDELPKSMSGKILRTRASALPCDCGSGRSRPALTNRKVSRLPTVSQPRAHRFLSSFSQVISPRTS